MDVLKPPTLLKMTGHVDANWMMFKQQFQLYIAMVVALLLTIASADAIEVFNMFVQTQGQKQV